jgi:hypothetical protein
LFRSFSNAFSFAFARFYHYIEIATGGAVGSGSAIVGEGETTLGTGGAIAGGHCFWTQFNITCACNQYTHLADGGAVGGGTAAVIHDYISGGAVCGGSVQCVASGVYDGFIFCYPLDEDNGYYGYRDVVNSLNSDGGYDLATDTFRCVTATVLDDDFIELPLDNYSGAFTLSMFIRIDDMARRRVLFNRGDTFLLGYSHINQIMATIVSDSIEYTAYSVAMLDPDRWYHVGCVWTGTELQIYINGVLDGTADVTAMDTPMVSNLIGRYAVGNCRAALQEVRMVAGAKRQSYLAAEWRNACGGIVISA